MLIFTKSKPVTIMLQPSTTSSSLPVSKFNMYLTYTTQNSWIRFQCYMSTQVQYRYLLTSENDVITIDVKRPSVQSVSCSNTYPQFHHFPPELPSAGALRLGKQSLMYGL
jgi:hypothetical protein